MKQMKKVSFLTAGLIGICLLQGASMAQAQDVCLDGDTVLSIKNLETVTDQYGVLNIDVDFRYATGYEVYGSSLGGFPFDFENAEEDVYAVMAQINNALVANNPIPGSAGQSGQDSYFIGVESETELNLTVIAAAGSENLAGFWDPCTGANDCIAGAATLKADQRFVYADLNRAKGGACSGGPPPLTITPGFTGSWYDPARNNEGYNIEIIGSSLDPEMLAYFYTYTDDGNQMWIFGQGPFSGSSATLPAIVTSGARFGENFDPDDVILEEWGTLTFSFTSCDAGTATYNSPTMGTGTANIVRLSAIIGLACP